MVTIRTHRVRNTTVLGLLPALLSAAYGGTRAADVPRLRAVRELEQSLNRPCDPSLLEGRIDFTRLVAQSIGDLDPPDDVRLEFTGGIRRSFDMASAICADIEEGGSYTFLRFRDVDGQPRALFRLIGPHGVNYHEYVLDETEPARILDIYVHANGELLSRMIRRGFLPLASRFRNGLSDRIAPGESTYLDNLPRLTEMLRLFREGDHRSALDVFESLPDELKRHRTVLMQRFAIAMELGGSEYDAAMADLHGTFPDDPSLGLVLIDYHFARGQYDRCLELVAALDRAVGGDPYLDFLRSSVLLSAGRVSQAKRAARRAIEAEPGLEDPYWNLVSISLQEKEFTDTVRLLSEIEESLGLVIGDLADFPEYREFVESEAYAAWRPPAD